MKTIKILSLVTLSCCLSVASMAQEKKETIKVSGNCGMCKNKIEKAAKSAGASFAAWDTESKVLTVKYPSTSTNNAKIQQAVAAAGYDTKDVKATDEAYNKLHSCCKYEREGLAAKCCDSEKCGISEDCCGGTDCCKDGKCAKMSAAEGDEKAACCKDGKCGKEGHNGKDCCKQS